MQDLTENLSGWRRNMLKIFYEDGEVIVVEKPAGVESQARPATCTTQAKGNSTARYFSRIR